ncbi:DUF1501 domain-containing protein [Variovorax sp. J22R133]|uniref:DUF1501 domain-containing protein n=1 Tax=Variovorax brevis TaxID=3053503 RepID=UPI0025778996|nr:DUF1501 domain-containing protein [Variovorax sp. J22R133]MDM0115378.1 DUF1501 domain-containing protein [Variovorax sp. J22R133]
MQLIDPQDQSRRAFLRRTGQFAMTGAALPFALNLAAMAEAAAQTATDYKALVCVFLLGGNDQANTVVTYDEPSYNAYSQIRGGAPGQGGIAIPRSALTPTLLKPTNPLPDGRQFALHPSMADMAHLYNNEGKVAVLLNVGSLVEPITRRQVRDGSRDVPPKLFSHNDQQSIWQSSSPEGSTIGWGGNIGDLVLGQNTNALFTCISVTGNAVFLSGDTAMQYQLSSAGAVAIHGIKDGAIFSSRSVSAALAQIVQQQRTHLLENEYNAVTRRSIATEGIVTDAMGQPYPANAFSADNDLASQLEIVARLIRGRSTLGARRQVFFVSMGGFDLHDNLIAKQPRLLGNLSTAMTQFHREMVALGLSNQVTQFTASDFGRTLASNGDGSDHGWGSHHFVVGGAVKGKDKIYGTPPVVSINSNPALPGYEGHVGGGRLIPSTSVDQYAATLAKWFGISEANLPGILPNLKNFGVTANGIDYPKDVGFMA